MSSLPPELAALHRQPPEDVLPLPSGRVVSCAELRCALREQVADRHSMGARPLRGDRAGAGLVAAAWRHVVYRQARAVLTLLDVELDTEAQANARICLEHAIVLRRLALAADNAQLDPLLEALAHDQQRRSGRQLDYLDRLDSASGGQNEALLAAARTQHTARLVPGDKNRPDVSSVKAHFLAVPSGVHFHSVYSRLSESSHAGLVSATPYLVPEGWQGQQQLVVPKPRPERWAETLAVLIWACSDVDDAMRRFLVDGDDIAERHLAIMARVGLATGTASNVMAE